MAFNTKQFIDSARQRGIPDEQTYKYLQSKGISLTGKPDHIVSNSLFGKVGKGIANFFTSSEQGVAKAGVAAFGPQQLTPEQATQNTQSVSKLIEEAHKFPVGNPRRLQLLRQAKQTASFGQKQAGQQLSNIPSNFQAGLDIAGVAGDVLAGGTFGKATKAMETGKLFRSAPTIATEAEELGSKVSNFAGKKLEERAAKGTSQKAIEAITKTATDVTPTEYKELLRKGLVEPKSLFKEAKVIPTENELKLAEQYKELLQSGDPVKNVDSVMNEIVKHDTAVGKYLETKKIIYNNNELRKAIFEKIGPIDDIYIPNPDRLVKLKSDLVNSLMSKIEKNDLRSLWKARKQFDQVIDRTLNAYGGSPTLKKEIAKGVRNGAQDFITDKLGNKVYSGHMKDMRNLYDLADTIGTKATKERRFSALAVWAKQHPVIWNSIKWGGGGVLGYEAAKKLGIPLP